MVERSGRSEKDASPELGSRYRYRGAAQFSGSGKVESILQIRCAKSLYLIMSSRLASDVAEGLESLQIPNTKPPGKLAHLSCKITLDVLHGVNLM